MMEIKTTKQIILNDENKFNTRWVKVNDIMERIDIIVNDIEHIRGRGTLESTKLLKWKMELKWFKTN